ncbi:hypothetical protein CISG_09775 [Coccidioides immitis RMSCC 3703]|uniref:Uncharacterized protein n=1 Tax=Coccidioides immitis RMSCC 3703 TaxID=454286 RepID=A0A0J8QJK2_COCIT|nr:hypothetical protein CISG_09775 [Coccidioides immitis RMSCC 3703]
MSSEFVVLLFVSAHLDQVTVNVLNKSCTIVPVTWHCIPCGDHGGSCVGRPPCSQVEADKTSFLDGNAFFLASEQTRRSALGMESYFNIESTEGQTSRGGPARTTQSWLFHGSAEGYLAVQELGFALAALSRSQALSHHGNGAERVWGLENGMMLITRKGILLD